MGYVLMGGEVKKKYEYIQFAYEFFTCLSWEK